METEISKDQRIALMDRIRVIRASKNLSLEEVATRCHCTRQYLSSIENGKHSVGIDILLNILNAIDAKIEIKDEKA